MTSDYIKQGEVIRAADIIAAFDEKENVSNKKITLTNSAIDYPTTQLLTTELNKKQNNLTAGTGITINGTTISASSSYLGSIAKGTGTTTYLRNDGTWATPSNTTYAAGTGITISGTTISVKFPAPDYSNIESQNRFTIGNPSWTNIQGDGYVLVGASKDSNIPFMVTQVGINEKWIDMSTETTYRCIFPVKRGNTISLSATGASSVLCYFIPIKWD
jgi:hypothetical protein